MGGECEISKHGILCPSYVKYPPGSVVPREPKFSFILIRSGNIRGCVKYLHSP